MAIVTPQRADELNRIRLALQALGVRHNAWTVMSQISRVLDRVGDADLVVDALLLRPRPAWLHALVGDDLSLRP